MADVHTVIMDIKAFIQSHGGEFEAWYVGDSPTPRTTLFDTHKVKKESDAWIYLIADNADTVFEAVSYFLNMLGTKGQVGSPPEHAAAIYAFRLTASTSPKK
jgi:hypothetical protein